MIKIHKIHNALTGEETFLEIEETEEERQIREAIEAEQAKFEAELAAKEEARQALLNKLGITGEEAKLLLG